MQERIKKLEYVLDESLYNKLIDKYDELSSLKELASQGKSSDIKAYRSKLSSLERTLSSFESEFSMKTYDKLSDVHEYLVDEGYKIAERTIYKHRDEGKIKPTAGIYMQDKVDEYASKYLVRSDVGSVSEQKAQIELEYKQMKLERERITIAELTGELMPRAKVGYEFAARIEELKRGFEEIESSLPILLVGADERTIRETIRAKHDYLLERYSRRLENLKE